MHVTNDPSSKNKKYIEIKPKIVISPWEKPKIEIEAKHPISTPLLHDFIVSIIHHSAKEVFPLMRNIPQLNNSKLYKDYCLEKSLQEWIINQKKSIYDPSVRKYTSTITNSTKADAIWLFRSTKYENNILFKDVVVHEVKTGHYDLKKVFDHYLSTYHKATIDGEYVSIRLYIWAWKYHIEQQLPIDIIDDTGRMKIEFKKGSLKQIELEYLLPLIKENLFKLANKLEGDI